MYKDNPMKIGIALGGGAVLGAVHLGVLQALEEHDIYADMLTGTSIGAVMAAQYAFGLAPHDIKERMQKMDWWDVSKFAWSNKNGLLNNHDMENFIKEQIGEVNFSDCPIPLAFIATDLCSGKKVVLDQHGVAEAAMISSCVPALYSPHERNGKLLVDGGLVENVPISPLQSWGADFILAVNINGSPENRSPDGMIDVLMSSFDIAVDSHTRSQLRQADYVLQLNLSHYSRTDPSHTAALFDEGYNICKQQIHGIEKALKRRPKKPLRQLRRIAHDWLSN